MAGAHQDEATTTPRRRVALLALVAVLVAAAVTALAPPGAEADGDAPATLVGTVTDASSAAPVAGAWVTVMRTYDHQPVAEVVADGAGSFVAEVPAGTYLVYLIDPTAAHRPGFAGAPDVHRVRAGETVHTAATMVASTGGISGRITDAVDGAAVGGAWVVALGASGAPEQAARADAAGRYALTGLRAGPHRLAVLDPTAAHTTEYWDDATDVAAATAVDVPAGGTATADASLARQTTSLALTSLRGTVTETGTATALGGVLVLALRSSDLRLAGAAQSSSTGRWRLNVPLGGYRLAFVDPTGGHAMEWHPDQPFDRPGSAVTVSAPAVVDAALARTTGAVTGSVRDAGSGAAVPGSWILAIDAGGDLRGAVAGADGSFSIPGLPVGTYRAAILDPGGDRRLEFWDDEADFAGADAFTVTAGTSAVVDADLDTRDDDLLRADAVGWWDAAAGLDAAGALPDLSGGGNAMALHPGALVPDGPARLAPDPARGANLFSPGWDDMYLDTPDPGPFDGLDVAWEGDLERVLTIDPGQPVDWVLHQGSTSAGTFAWAVGVHVATQRIVVAYSTNGVDATTVVTGAEAEAGPGRTGVTLDPATGTVEVHRQDFGAAVGDFDLPYDRWETVATVPGSGPVDLFDSPAPVRHSSTVAADTIDGQWLVGWFRALYRLRVRSSVGGAEVAALDVAHLPGELAWEDLGGLPPVGDTTTASVADLAGGAGETWTVHNYDTTSYPMLLVRRPVILFGNGSYGEVPVDDWAFDATSDRDVSIWVVYDYVRLGHHYLPLVAHRNRSGASPGYAITQVLPVTPAPLGYAGDGVTQGVFAAPPTPDEGAANVSGLQLDLAAPYALDPAGPAAAAYTNGVASRLWDLAGIGSLSSPDTPLRVATWSDDARIAEGYAFVGLAVFDRTLTPEEIDRLPSEFGLG